MKKSSWLGFIILGCIAYYGIYLNSKWPMIYVDQNAFFMVVGCTIAISLIAYPYASLTRIIDYFVWGLIFKKKNKHLKISQDIAGARSSYLINQNYLTTEESHPFLREAVMFLLNRNIHNDAFAEILENRSDFFKKKYNEDAFIIKSLAKYPILFGVVAFLIKTIEILATLNNGKHPNLGYEFAVAAVSILWGLALAGFIFYPLADSATKSAEEDQIFRNLIVDGMILIRQKATDEHFQAFMRGYLNINDRSEFKITSAVNQYPFAVAPKIENKDEPVVHETRHRHSKENQDALTSKDMLPQIRVEAVAPEAEPVAPQAQVNQENTRVPTLDEIQAKMVVGSELQNNALSAGQPVPTTAPTPTTTPNEVNPASGQKFDEGKTYTRTRTKTEVSGHVEEAVRIETNVSLDLAQFKFKDLRKELKEKPRHRRKIS